MCYDSNAHPPLPPHAGGPTRSQALVLDAADGNRFAAYMASPQEPGLAQMVILPDIRGLHQFYKDLAVRFAEQGISALAIDYFGRTAGLTARDDSFEFMPHVQQIRFDTFQADIRAALAYLQQHGRPGAATFTLGFCMGGTLSFQTGTQDLALTGVIGFYAGMSRDFGGAGTLLERAPLIKYPALGLFGGADQGITADQVESFDHALDRAGVQHTVITYPGAPHSFFDRRQTDFAEASADAWTQVLDFVSSQTRQSA